MTAEIREVARRGGDRETELWATALRWVALLELGDPGYRQELAAFVAGARQGEVPRQRMAATMDSGIIAAFRGDLATAEECFAEVESHPEPEHSDHAFMTHHIRWSVLLLYGRVAEAEALLDKVGAGHPQAELLRAITAAERGDPAAVRGSPPGSRPPAPRTPGRCRRCGCGCGPRRRQWTATRAGAPRRGRR